MATVTEPIMTDATGQSIDSKLNSLLGKMDNLAAAFQPNASGIVYSNATSGLTGDDVQEAIDEMAADVSEIKQSLSDLETLEKTVSGAIVTFDDGSDLPMPKLEVAIEPQQDLHGYDHPWVGGAGKNKLPLTVDNIKALNGGAASWSGNTKTINDVTFTILTDAANNVIGINANGTANGNASLNIGSGDLSGYQGDILNGCPSGGSTSTYRIFCQKIESPYNIYVVDTGDGAEFPTMDGTQLLIIRIYHGYNAQNVKFYPMIRESTESNTFAPYSNICPISGWDDVNVTVCDDIDNPTVTHTYTIDLDGTRYGGTLDVVSGLLTITDGYIASYNSETLPSTWISDRDVYTEGTTPTVGAEVVYKLATSQTTQLTPTQVNSLLGVNNIWADTGDLEIIYFVNNSLVQSIYDMINVLNS